MKQMTLQQIAQACGGKLVCPEGQTIPDTEAACVVIDSRQIEQDGIFIATKGERVDGHSFIPQVFEKGALGVVCEELPEVLPGVCIQVEDSFRALQDIAAYYREQLTIPVVGITGSVGKTSTKEMIAGVLSEKYNVLKTEGNFNNEIGVPLMLLKIRPEHQIAVLEMGINHFGEMHNLSRMAKPDICVMTNIGQCHLEFLGTRDGILKAKSEIFDFANPNAQVIVNGDDDKLQLLGTEAVPYLKVGMTLTRFGRGKQNELYADAVKMDGLFGSSTMVHTPDGTFPMEVRLPGEHQIYNALAAAAVALKLGMTPEEIAAGAVKVQAMGGRSHLIQTGKYVVLDDCYNANPVSMKAAVELLTNAVGRKVAILGDMFELGEKETELHAGVGTFCGERGIDVLICVGALSSHMAQAAGESGAPGMKVYHFEELEPLRGRLPELLQPGDNILIKASHAMHFEKLVEDLTQNP